MSIIRFGLACLVAGVFAGAGYAKLPPPSEEQKAKAEEAKAKADEAAKKNAELLGKSQDRVAERYLQQMRAKGIEVKPTPSGAPAPPPAAESAAPAPAAAATK
ncbi:MAG: formate dehydrogenase [Sterolibacteriaceae bacterium]|nr:formate dehydrogenase [Sterolibacteriaceae bacterium]MBK9084307.1 formate dehydrogenase [Sterolibacteriaceae bacterium]